MTIIINTLEYKLIIYYFIINSMDNNILYIILVGIVFFAVLAIWIYNSLISAKNNAEESKSAIDTVFQNRYDLIPNLVEVVKQYAKHEKETLEGVVKMRSNLVDSWWEPTKERFAEENMLSWTMKSIFALSENYPDLKADKSFIQLQNQWTEIEDRLQGARRAYNAAVKALRNKKEMFPSNIIAWMMTLPVYDMFEADEVAKVTPKAKDLFN